MTKPIFKMWEKVNAWRWLYIADSHRETVLRPCIVAWITKTLFWNYKYKLIPSDKETHNIIKTVTEEYLQIYNKRQWQ